MRGRRRLIRGSAAALMLGTLLLPGCREGVPPPTSPSTSSLVVNLELNSAVPTELVSVILPFAQLDALPQGGGVPVTLSSGSQEVELTTIGTGVELAREDLDPDTFEAIGVVFDPVGATVQEVGSPVPEPLALATTTAVVPGVIEVADGAEVTVTLQLDAAASLTQLGDDSWSFSPVLQLEVPTPAN